jgi:hypothetical protein
MNTANFSVRRLVLACLAAAVVFQGCASSGPEHRPQGVALHQDVALVACTPAIRSAACDWQGSYPHVRATHCEVSCAQDHVSAYAATFIDTCNDARLEEVCYSTVQNPGCQYYVDGGGRYVVSANLGVRVGDDRNNACASSTVSSVVLDGNYRVVTMYPGN